DRAGGAGGPQEGAGGAETARGDRDGADRQRGRHDDGAAGVRPIGDPGGRQRDRRAAVHGADPAPGLAGEGAEAGVAADRGRRVRPPTDRVPARRLRDLLRGGATPRTPRCDLGMDGRFDPRLSSIFVFGTLEGESARTRVRLTVDPGSTRTVIRASILRYLGY